MLTVAAAAVERLAQLFAVLLLALALLAAVGRRVRQHGQASRQAAERRIRPILLDLIGDPAAGADPADLGDPVELPAELGRYVDDLALNLAGKLRGSDRSALVDLLHRRGVVDRARRDLAAASSVRRLRAVELLGSLGLPQTLGELTARLYDRNVDVRRSAVRAVGRIPTAGGAQALLDLLDAPTRQVPEHCVTLALLRCGQPAVVPLVEAIGSTERPRARLAAAAVLGWMGELSAVPALLGILDAEPGPQGCGPAGATDLMLAAIDALGRIGVPAAAGPLSRRLAATERPAVRQAAARALGRLGDPASADALLDLLDTDHRLALQAAGALHQLGPAGRARLGERAESSAEVRDVLRLSTVGSEVG